MRIPLSALTRLFTLCAALASMQTAHAVDGVVLIDQNRALAGNVTPGDTPGFPVTISQPGSYRLSSNLSPPLYLSAIEVTAPNVSIDFNGFALVAQPKPSLCCNDIAVQQTGTAAKGLTIANGHIVNFVGPVLPNLREGPDGILEVNPVVLRDLNVTIPTNYSSGEVQLPPFSRIERVSGAKLFVLMHCPTGVAGSTFDTIQVLQLPNDIPGGKCVISGTGTR